MISAVLVSATTSLFGVVTVAVATAVAPATAGFVILNRSQPLLGEVSVMDRRKLSAIADGEKGGRHRKMGAGPQQAEDAGPWPRARTGFGLEPKRLGPKWLEPKWLEPKKKT